MKRELIEAWIKFLDNNYSVGPIDYEAVKIMDTEELKKALRNLAIEACKKKICMEYKNFSNKVSQIPYKDMSVYLNQIKFASDGIFLYLKDEIPYHFNKLHTEELLVLIKYSNILNELYHNYNSYEHTCLINMAKKAKLNNAKFEANIQVRTTSNMNEATNICIEYLLKDYDTTIYDSILPILTDTDEKYDCIVSSYYSDPITKECVFHSCNHYVFEYIDNEWKYKKI